MLSAAGFPDCFLKMSSARLRTASGSAGSELVKLSGHYPKAPSRTPSILPNLRSSNYPQTLQNRHSLVSNPSYSPSPEINSPIRRNSKDISSNCLFLNGHDNYYEDVRRLEVSHREKLLYRTEVVERRNSTYIKTYSRLNSTRAVTTRPPQPRISNNVLPPVISPISNFSSNVINLVSTSEDESSNSSIEEVFDRNDKLLLTGITEEVNSICIGGDIFESVNSHVVLTVDLAGKKARLHQNHLLLSHLP